jgi:hypothetical protein
MTKDKALKMAIDTLQNAKRRHFYCEDTYYSCPKHEDGCADDRQPYRCNCGADELNAEIEISINACKEALEQPAQEPKVWKDAVEMYEANVYGDGNVYRGLRSQDSQIKTYHVKTYPHQWQGLTDDEVDSIYPCAEGVHDFRDIVRAIEAKLKEKNNG